MPWTISHRTPWLVRTCLCHVHFKIRRRLFSTCSNLPGLRSLITLIWNIFQQLCPEKGLFPHCAGFCYSVCMEFGLFKSGSKKHGAVVKYGWAMLSPPVLTFLSFWPHAHYPTSTNSSQWEWQNPQWNGFKRCLAAWPWKGLNSLSSGYTVTSFSHMACPNAHFILQRLNSVLSAICLKPLSR